jgi:hypothetical protein
MTAPFANYSVTRQAFVDAVMECRGWTFRHQARGENKAVDCVGLLHVGLTAVNYPQIIDVEGYQRTPPATVIYDTLCQNFIEIPVDEVGLGDVYLMRLGGRKAKHVSVLVRDVTDIERGLVPEILHAYALGDKGRVEIDALSNWIDRCVHGFRLKGLID